MKISFEKRDNENPFSAELSVEIDRNDKLQLLMKNEMRHSCFINLSWEEARELKRLIEIELFVRRMQQ